MLKKIIASGVLGAAIVAGSFIGAGSASADVYSQTAGAVCDVLDQYPNDTGVTMVVTTAINAGFDGEQTAELIYGMVNNYCPSHTDELMTWAEHVTS